MLAQNERKIGLLNTQMIFIQVNEELEQQCALKHCEHIEVAAAHRSTVRQVTARRW